eukprot:gene41786-55433_t
MIGKIIVHGDTRDQALARMRTALNETVIEGIQTNIPLHRELMVDANVMFELVLTAPQALVEPVSEALMNELGSLSVSVEDADADTEAEHALFGEPGMPPPRAGWDRSTLRALFGTEQEAADALTLLLAQDWTTGLAAQGLQAVEEQDWVRLTQSQFAPVAITPAFWIVPSWHEPPAAAERVLRLDPGLAFGTGTHATTRGCLEMLATLDPADTVNAVDVGCGSGILAIAMAKLWKRSVIGGDNDAEAVEVAQENAGLN